jgi:hypothetical protein
LENSDAEDDKYSGVEDDKYSDVEHDKDSDVEDDKDTTQEQEDAGIKSFNWDQFLAVNSGSEDLSREGSSTPEVPSIEQRIDDEADAGNLSQGEGEAEEEVQNQSLQCLSERVRYDPCEEKNPSGADSY